MGSNLYNKYMYDKYIILDEVMVENKKQKRLTPDDLHFYA